MVPRKKDSTGKLQGHSWNTKLLHNELAASNEFLMRGKDFGYSRIASRPAVTASVRKSIVRFGSASRGVVEPIVEVALPILEYGHSRILPRPHQ